METTFYQFGVEYLRWEKNGHIYEAVKEQVEFFGKEFFEWDPEDNEEEYTKENPYKYFDDWKEEHPNELAVPFPEWI